MKLLGLVVIGVLLSANLQAQEVGKVEISGTVKGLTTGKVYLQRFNKKIFQVVDSATLKNGTFEFKEQLKLPELYGVGIHKKGGLLSVFLDPGKVNITLDTTNYYHNSVVTGSVSQDLFTAYKQQKGVKIEEFIKSNPTSIVSAYLLYHDFASRLTPAEIETNMKLLDPKLSEVSYVRFLKDKLAILNSVGEKAPDFEAATPDGKRVRLSSHFGGYLLLDFWASWCVPCRKENPNLVATYQKYHNKGFDIFAVSLDNVKGNWVKAVNDDHLSWTQVSDLGSWNSALAKLYDVKLLPSNVLIDPNGVIIARNLRGEALSKKLDELFSGTITKAD